jgi:RNA-directed DNA polymerase
MGGSGSNYTLSVTILEHAYRLCRSNGGAAGVDGVTFEGIEATEEGLEGWLRTLAAELREERYRGQAVRRVMIPKPDGGERPLGIPTIRDRVVQQAAKLVMEPIFEADFEPDAYGYRPRRGALDAVKEVQVSIVRGESHVVDADLSKYFDTIPHRELLKAVARRLSDRKMLRLVKMWLKAPVEETDAEGRKTLTGGQGSKVGTPQGGVISPLEPTYRSVDRYAESLLRKFLVRRHKVPGRGTLPFSNRYLYGDLGLVRLQDRRRVSRSQALT